MPLRSMLSTLFAASVALALAGCEPAPTPDTDPHLQPVPPVATGDNAFQVRVTLSETATAALEADAGAVMVSVDYFGYPSVAAQQRQLPGADEPWLPLARHEVALDATGVARFPEIALDPERLQMVEEARPHVRVEVHSTGAPDLGPDQAAGEGNLLDCGTFQGELAAAVRAGVDLDCKLIAE